MSEHEQYWNLCTAYSLGTISDRELETLQCHLKTCTECRDILEQAEQIVAVEVPLDAPEFRFLPTNAALTDAISQAHQRVLRKIGNLDFTGAAAMLPAPLEVQPTRTWLDRKRWALSAVAVVLILIATVMVWTTWDGGMPEPKIHRSSRLSAEANRGEIQAKKKPEGVVQDVDGLLRDRNELRSESERDEHSLQQMQQELQERDRLAMDLKTQLRMSGEVVGHLQAQLGEEQARRAELEQRLAESEKSLHEVEQRLETTVAERASYMASAASLERRLGDVSRELKEKTSSLEQQEELLSHDRDIRDVIGARDLYVAEVNDVGRDAKTEEPFGRVFFTKGKSLIFYAYDLERQGALRKPATFQAWGRRGRDFTQALPLGIMYLDNSAKRRWVLRLDDPSTLAKIDAVFVTVEPAGGSERPTGKPLLFAYLKIEPNHP